MAMTNSLLKYLGEQITAADATWKYLKDEAAGKTLTWDKFFESTSQFWINSLASCWDLAPFSEGTPVVYDTVGNGAATYTGTPIAVAPIPSGTVLASKLIPLKTTKGTATGTPAPAVQSDGTLKIDVNGLTDISAGDLFLVAVHYPLTGGGTKTVAVLVLSVT